MSSQAPQEPLEPTPEPTPEQTPEQTPEPTPDPVQVESSQSDQTPSSPQDLPPAEPSDSPSSPDPVADTEVEAKPSWPDPSVWEDISDLDVSGLPEAAHPHFNRVKELYSAKVDGWKSERSKVNQAVQDLEETRANFHRMMEQMDTTGETKVVSEELEKFRGGFNNLASENIALAQRMFKLEHPNFERYPQDVRSSWAKEMSDESFYTRYTGDTIYDKMKEAWNFALFRTKAQPQPQKPPKAQVPDTMRQTSRNAAQGLVADGRRASSMPSPDPEDMSFDDILSLHDHLLKS